jgi:CelD/BcsL family acetyltransferase involved in cellulose biosynthesis
LSTGRGGADLTVDVADSLDAGEKLRDEWATLHVSSGSRNPFAHPAWMLTWAHHFCRDDQVEIMAVRRRGRLIGVAPFAWVALGPGVRALHPMGNQGHASFTEIPAVLAGREDGRHVLREVVRHLQHDQPGWHWVRLSLDHDQGWFEAQWIDKGASRASPFVVPYRARAFVLMDLPQSWDDFVAARKRNVRESIRRSYNRLGSRVGTWSVDQPVGPALRAAVDDVVSLQGARSAMSGKPHHPALFGSDRSVSFYREAVVEMAAAGLAEVSLLRLDDRISAGMVILRAGDGVFTSVSGAEPQAWDLGPGTILLSELARREIGRRTKMVNLSTGPNQAKLRWSERLEFGHDFVVVGPGLGSRARFAFYAQLSLLADISRARQWDVKRSAD